MGRASKRKWAKRSEAMKKDYKVYERLRRTIRNQSKLSAVR